MTPGPGAGPGKGALDELRRRARQASQPATPAPASDGGGALDELRRRTTAATAAPEPPDGGHGSSGSWGDDYDYGATDQVLRGAMLHWDTKTRAAVDAALAKIKRLGGGAPLTTEYNQRKTALDTAREQWEAQHPVGKYGYELAGGLLPTIATLGAAAPEVAAVEAAPATAAAASRLARLGQAGTALAKTAHAAGKTAAAFGAVAAAGDTEGDLADYAKHAGAGALLGYGTGAALVPAIGGAVGVGRALGVPKVVSLLAQKGAGALPESRVSRALATLADATGDKGAAAKALAPFVETDAAAGHVPAELPADFPALPIDRQGPAVRSIARDIAAKPTPAGVRITQALGDRSQRMRDIVTQRLERGVGMTRGAGEQLVRGIGEDEAARTATNDAQQVAYEMALAGRKAELASRAAEPELPAPDPVAAWEGVAGRPAQNNIAALRAQRGARSAAAAENFGAARASSVPVESPALDALTETDLGNAAFRFGEEQTAQRRAAAEALGQPMPARAPAAPAVSVPRATVPAAAAPAPVSTVGGIPGATGKAGQAILRTGEALPVEYRVVSRGDVQPSHDPFSFAPNPNYPEGVQGRDYLRNKGIQNAVTRRTFEFSPEIALNPSEMLSEGVPTILPNGTVVAGNERAMLLARTAQHAPERSAAYVAQLKARAGDYGIDPAAIDAVPNPMLVRVLANPAEHAAGPARWAELNRLSDEVATKGKSTVEEGAARATAFLEKPEALKHLADTLDPNQTVNEYLGTSDGSRFMRQLVRDGIVRADELSRYTDAGGALNPEGRTAVRNMLLSTAVTRPAVVADAPAGALVKIEHAVPSIVSTRGTPFDIAPLTTEALHMLGEARDLGVTVRDLASQHGLFGDVQRSPMATHLAEFIEQNKPGTVKTAFRKFGTIAKEQVDNEGAGDMFGPSPFQSIADVYHATFGTPSAPVASLAEHIPAAPIAAAPIEAAPVAPIAPPVAAPQVAQPTTAPAPVRAAVRPPGAAASELPPLVVPEGKVAPAAPTGLPAEFWDKTLRTAQQQGREIPWVDAPKAPAGVVPPPVPQARQYDPETIHYAKQYYAKVARLGVHDGQGGKLATQANGALRLWEAARNQLRADPLWANADDVFANQSRHIDMTELGRNLSRTTLDPAGRKALATSLDAVEQRVANASPSEREAFQSAAQASIADYFRKGGSRTGLVKQLGDASSQWSRRVALATGDPEAPAAFRAALLTPSRPMPPELAPLVEPAEVALAPDAAARRLGYGAVTAKLAPTAEQAAAGRSLPAVEASIAALSPGEQRGAQQGAAARLLGAWEGASQRVKSPGASFFAKSPERARQVALAFPSGEDAASFQGFAQAADQAQALNNFVLPTSGSSTQPRQAVSALRELLAGSPIADEALKAYGLTSLPLRVAKGVIQSRRTARQAAIDELLSQWFVTPGAALEQQAGRATQLQGKAGYLLPRVAGALGGTVVNP